MYLFDIHYREPVANAPQDVRIAFGAEKSATIRAENGRAAVWTAEKMFPDCRIVRVDALDPDCFELGEAGFEAADRSYCETLDALDEIALHGDLREYAA